MTDVTNEIDIFCMGYGTIAKFVMKDTELTAEAKAIYCYIASYAGSGDTAYPSVELMCHDLNFGKERFHKHRKCLIEKGYIVIEKHATPEGKFTNNLYVINKKITTDQTKPTKKATEPAKPLPDFEARGYQPTDPSAMAKHTANKNSVTNNNQKNNSFEEDEDDNKLNITAKNQKNDFYYWREKWIAHFGTQTPYTAHIHEGLQQWVRYFGDEEILSYAFMRAGRYGAKSYAYLDNILRNWWDDGLRTADAIYDRDIAQGY